MIKRVKITVDYGVKEVNHFIFNGDELTSPEGQAVMWLKEQDAKRADSDLEKSGGA